MKSISLLIASLLSCFGLSAQSEYALFPNDSIIYASEHYEFPNVQISSDTLDGVVYQQLHPTYEQSLNSPFFSNSNCLSLEWGCFDWKNSHWIGDDLQYDTNGVYSFINRSGEFFNIESKAKVDSFWLFFLFENGNSIRAKVDSISFLLSEVVNDTVKFISFQRLNGNGVPIVDPINDLEILIGKNIGLISSPNFLNYMSSCFDMEYNLEVFNYQGEMSINVPIEETNRYKIWNMNIGDEFHTKRGEADLFPTYKEISITSKYWDSNSETFIFGKHVKIGVEWKTYFDGGVSSYWELSEIDEMDTVVLNDYLFLDDSLFGISEDGLKRRYTKNNFNDSQYQIGKQLSHFVSDSVIEWCEGQFNIFGVLDYYIEGCGGPFYSYGSPEMGFYQGSYLYYVNKGNYIWGEPFYLNQEELSSNQMRIFPNPVSDKITIQFQQVTNGQIQLLDIAGRLVFEVPIKDGNMSQELNVTNQSPGVYFIRLIGSGAELKTEKIIIQ